MLESLRYGIAKVHEFSVRELNETLQTKWNIGEELPEYRDFIKYESKKKRKCARNN